MTPNLVTRLLLLAAATGSMFKTGARTLRSMGLADDQSTPSSRNRGKGRTNRQAQRTALKIRNVRKFRRMQ